MKKMITLAIVFLLLIASVSAQDKSIGELWNELSDLTKRAFIKGWTMGASAVFFRSLSLEKQMIPEEGAVLVSEWLNDVLHTKYIEDYWLLELNLLYHELEDTDITDVQWVLGMATIMWRYYIITLDMEEGDIPKYGM